MGSWKVVQKSTNRKVLSEDRYQRKYFHHGYHTMCLVPDECYKFVIDDNYGDGLCAPDYECGNYTVSLGGAVLRQVAKQKKFKTDVVDDICAPPGGPITTSPPTSPPTLPPTLPPTSSPTANKNEPLMPC